MDLRFSKESNPERGRRGVFFGWHAVGKLALPAKTPPPNRNDRARRPGSSEFSPDLGGRRLLSGYDQGRLAGAAPGPRAGSYAAPIFRDFMKRCALPEDEPPPPRSWSLPGIKAGACQMFSDGSPQRPRRDRGHECAEASSRVPRPQAKVWRGPGWMRDWAIDSYQRVRKAMRGEHPALNGAACRFGRNGAPGAMWGPGGTNLGRRGRNAPGQFRRRRRRECVTE